MISAAAWADGGRRFDWCGHAVFVRDGGPADAEVLLLIHGFPTSSWDWAAVWPALAARWRVTAPDLLGFGASAKPPRHEYSIAEQADLCEALLVAAGVESYHVLAHDYGDTVAQELLARQHVPGERPQLRSVGFLNGGLFPETHRQVPMQRLLRSPLGPLVARFASRTTFARSLRRIFGPDTPPSDDFIDGAADPVSGAHMAARYRELVPDVDVTLLPRIGHYPQVEAPEAVVAAYLEFRARG